MRRVVRLIAMCLVAFSWSARAQEPILRAERSVDYRTGRLQDLKATVGPVRIQSVEFSDLGRGAQGGFPGLPRGGPGSEASTTIRSQFAAENPSADEWEVTFTLEFLDKSGGLIDKVTKRASWEGESKPYNFDHTLLSYVVPLIDRVRITMHARLD